MRGRLFPFLLLGLLCAPAAHAKKPAAHAKQPAAHAEQPAAQAKKPAARAERPAAVRPDGALKAAEDRVRTLRRAAPLTVRQALVVQGAPRGQGVYTPSDGRVVDGVLHIYVELHGYQTRESRSGAARAIRVTGTFFDAENHEIGTLPLGAHRDVVHDDTGRMWLAVQATLKGKAPPGRYAVRLNILDQIGGSGTHTTLPFVVVAPKAH